MTDDFLGRMVRDADPYPPSVVHDLAGAEQDLLEEIVSEEVPRRRRRNLTRSVAAAGIAAAALAGALALTTTHADAPISREKSGTVTYSALALKAAEDNPRLLIGESGWKAINVYGFTEETGTIAFGNGTRQLEMNWYPADQYASYREDRLQVSKPEPVTVDSQAAELFTYSNSDFAVQVKPHDDAFVELRTGGNWTRAEFDRVLATVKRVDVRTWLAALPPEIVTPDRAGDQASKILTGVPLPPGFDDSKLDELGTNDEYQFGAQVTSRVGCGWIVEWKRAKQAGDAAAVRRAADAMASSHDWKVLQDMNDEGDWPEVFWEISDTLAAGKEPKGYEDALGCTP